MRTTIRNTTDTASRPSRPLSVCHAVGARVVMLACLIAACCVAAPAAAQLNRMPIEAEGIGVTERLGEQVPLNLPFITSDGETVRLETYFEDGKPVIIALVYYDCPIVCTVVVEHLLKSVNDIDFKVGEDFNIVVVSFNTRETSKHAALKKAATLAGYKYGQTEAADRGWAFHTAAFSSVGELAASLGYRYKELANGEYAHPTTLFVLTPEGKISRYIHGLNYPPRDVRLSLMEAADGNLTESLGDIVTGFCFNWDPEAGGYVLQAFRVMQVGGAVSAVVMAGIVAMLFAGERIRRRAAAAKNPNDPNSNGPNSNESNQTARAPRDAAGATATA